MPQSRTQNSWPPGNLLDPGPRIDLAGKVEIPINDNVAIDSYPFCFQNGDMTNSIAEMRAPRWRLFTRRVTRN